MAFIQRKDKWAEVSDSDKIFVPSPETFAPDAAVRRDTPMGQYPKLDAAPEVRVGIMSAERISFSFEDDYICRQTGETFPAGDYTVAAVSGAVEFCGGRYAELAFEPREVQDCMSPAGAFSLDDVTIGVGFHWQRAERQRFNGRLRFIVDGGRVVAVNILPVEAYIYSVISSEMSSLSSLELLKAHAVISRSWLLAPMLNRRCERHDSMSYITDDEVIRWYGRDAHELFDVCADDHCQRYQGISRVQSSNVREAVRLTAGQVLTYGGEVCDARFSKCCGGITERFESCWGDTVPHGYLQPVYDAPLLTALPDLSDEENARRWIFSSPDAFCNTADESVLAEVLNGYDRETTDFYRWRVSYSQAELSELVCRRSGMDFGTVTALLPLERGASGRIVRLKVLGTKRIVTVGKELEIRRWLSPSHLYSSAFVVDRTPDGGFVFTGAGWGHGVGLCQVGAAVMGSRGYSYGEILAHYFPGAALTVIY